MSISLAASPSRAGDNEKSNTLSRVKLSHNEVKASEVDKIDSVSTSPTAPAPSSSSSSRSIFRSHFTFRKVLVASIVLRVALIKYSEWFDEQSAGVGPKYTDVDYRVFTDAARFVWEGTNGSGIGIGDPYERETYRYTPLLAVLLTPNVWLHPSFGKYLFAACDVLNGWLIYRMLAPRPHSREREQEQAYEATIAAALHLLNPLVFSISTRGSAEAVLAALVLGTLYCARGGMWARAAVGLGLSVHWKIYPVVYAAGVLGVVGRDSSGAGGSGVGGGETDGEGRGVKGFVRTLVNWRTVRFALISAATFFGLGFGCWLVWGYPFLYETYLYHLHRLDHRHNFSPYFYPTYLTYPSSTPSIPPPPTDGPRTCAHGHDQQDHLDHGHDHAHGLPLHLDAILRSPLASFLPQMTLALGTGLLFGRRQDDLVFTWFVQTVVFVVFNKVCTSQYFLWYLLLLPLLLPTLRSPGSPLTARKTALYICVWVGTQALWLAEAYRLEFLGENVFLGLWARGLVYVLGNCYVLVGIMDAYGRARRAVSAGG